MILFRLLTLAAIAICLHLTALAIPTDTLRITLREAEAMLLQNNTQLIAQKYGIEAAKADAIQAGLFPNPVFGFEGTLHGDGKWFDMGSEGEKAFGIDQTFAIAGQRGLAQSLAQEQTKMTERQYYDLLRSLRFELRKKYYSIAYGIRSYSTLTNQLIILGSMIAGYEEQLLKNNVALKDLVRLKTLYYQVNNDRTDIWTDIVSNRLDLQALLRTTAIIIPEIATTDVEKYALAGLSPDSLALTAEQNRPDVQIAESIAEQGRINLELQNRLGIPDVTLGIHYDQNGSYVPNYTSLQLSVPLPIFNRNQGASESARWRLKQAEEQLQQQKRTVRSETLAAYEKTRIIEEEYKKIDTNFRKQSEMLNEGMVENYRKGNISLLEFSDFFESYTQSILQINRLSISRLAAYEELNYVAGAELYR